MFVYMVDMMKRGLGKGNGDDGFVEPSAWRASIHRWAGVDHLQSCHRSWR